MTSVQKVERQISRLEKFDVHIRHLRGRDVRGDRRAMPGWGYQKAARDKISVTYWIQTRFKKRYPGFAVEVLDGNGHIAHGKNALSKVRKSYA